MVLVDAGNGTGRSARFWETKPEGSDLIWVWARLALLFSSILLRTSSISHQTTHLAAIHTNAKVNNMVLKEEEAAVYDRQLRVWGVETQRK